GIKDKLMQRGCNSFSVEKFTEAISECEYARFAPTKDEKSSMNNTFDMAVTAIIEIEEALKTTSKSLATNLIIAVLFGLMPANANAATTLETANAAYQAGNYQQAITLYEQVLSAGDCPQVYYNLANAYYRTNQISKAILNYERASLYSPTDAELIHNLELVRTKTQDKFIPAADIFLVKWYKAVVYLTSVYGWAVLSIIILCISLVSLLVYLFTNSLILRKVSFWATFITLIMFLGSIMAALQQNYYIHSNSFAVITVPEAEMKKSPEADGKKILSIHEGTRIKVIDDGMKDWKEIELPDGRTGWVKTAVLTMIKR
ncbi:MAG: tetratricopeptide repeat protein, partial [Bacteroidaceae bacterium]|nr:tetratricopeptide repeat protein [Bacteroidaceae bacterium]